MKNGIHRGYPTTEALEKHLGYWDDLRFPISAVRGVTGKPPTEIAYKGGMVLAFSTSSDNAVAFNGQFPHGYKQTLDVDTHLHLILPTAGAGAGVENVKFDLTYSWADIGGAFAAETTISATHDVQNEAADTHLYFELGDMLVANRGAGTLGVSSMVICSLNRDVSVANDYSSAVYLMEADFHIVSDAPGSRSEYVK